MIYYAAIKLKLRIQEKTIVMTTPGALALYHGHAAVVEAPDHDKWEIRIEGGERKRVRDKDLVLLHPGPVRGELPPPPPHVHPDWAELVELIGEDPLDFREFMLLAYNEDSPGAAFAAFHALAEGIYFKGSPAEGVKATPTEERETLLAVARAKENARAERNALLERIHSAGITEADRPALREIENVALGRAGSSKLLKELGIEAAPEPAHELLLRLGVWPESFDPWPARLDVDLEPVSGELLPAEADSAERVDLTDLAAYAIDDEGSDDPDDAISFADGLLWVHVADPAAAIPAESELDRSACERGTTSYLPEGIAPMLPTAAMARFGLGLNEISPALSFALRIGGEGEVDVERICLSLLRVERLTYRRAAEREGEADFTAMREALERFRRRRAAEGACFIRLPEVKWHIDGMGIVSCSPCPITPERELVANAMMAAGHAAAKFADAEGIPFPFLRQPEPEEALPEGDSPAAMFARRRAMSSGIVDTIPGKHAGMGLEPYARVTSPLRRYCDLLAHRQLRRHLAGEEPLSAEEIERRLAVSEEAAARRRKLEKYAADYCAALYFRQHPEWRGEGVVVDRQGDRCTILVPELAYEYKCRLRMNLAPDQPVRLAMRDARPARLAVTLAVEKS